MTNQRDLTPLQIVYTNRDRGRVHTKIIPEPCTFNIRCHVVLGMREQNTITCGKGVCTLCT